MIHGLYAITPSGLELPLLLEHAEAVLSGGASVLQLREKNFTIRASGGVFQASDEFQAQTEALLTRIYAVWALCNKYGALFILNDVSPAVWSLLSLSQSQSTSSVWGVHLGLDDLPIEQVRALPNIPSNLVIGASCYNDFGRAQQAVAQGVTYVAFGAVWPSHVKPQAVTASLELFAQARQAGMNSVAIGGITFERIKTLMQAGADAVAVISALFGQPNAWHTPEQVENFAKAWVEELNRWASLTKKDKANG